jgi:hypothetical protein
MAPIDLVEVRAPEPGEQGDDDGCRTDYERWHGEGELEQERHETSSHRDDGGYGRRA